MSGGFSPPAYSYGGGAGRYFIAKVVNRKDDPEQAGRLKIRVMGYQDDEANIPDDHLNWARPQGSLNNPQDGGVGTSILGATENSYVTGFYAGENKPIITGTIGKSGKNESGEGELDTSGRNHDMPPHSRDKNKGGGDKRYDPEKKQFEEESIVKHAHEKSPNPYGRKKGKEVDDDPQQNKTIADYAYA